MKICILTGYFAPEVTAETHLLLNLANDFVKLNAEVVVITSYPSRGIDNNLRLKYHHISEEITNGNIKIIRVGLKIKEGNNFFYRALRYLFISYSIYRAAKKIRPSVYLITSTPPFLGFAGALLSKIAPTVYNLQDFFPDSLLTTNKSKENKLVFRLFRIIEKYVYKKNSHIITISNDFKNILILKGVPEEKISVIYNWIDTDLIKPVKRRNNPLFTKYNLDTKAFYITYCGNIGYTQNLEMIIDVAKKIEDELDNIKFIFFGEGAWHKHILEYANEKKCNNIKFFPFQSYDLISSVFSLGDISLVSSKKNVSIGSIPSKTWSIMSASTAVLCSFDINSELCSIIEKADCGVCVPPEDANALENAIRFLYVNRTKTEQLGNNGRQYIIENLSRENSTSAYFDVLKELV